MKTIYADALTVGEELTNEPFMIQDLVHRQTKDGRPYLLGNLRDKTGSISYIFWDVPAYIDKIVRTGMVVLATGRVIQYKDALQLSLTDLNEAHSPDMEAFLPSSSRSRDELVSLLKEKIATVEDPLQSLLTAVLLSDHERLTLIANAPAARGMHHAYIGGLLDHTLSMAEIGEMLATHYPHVNRDLLMSGILLHDVGKVIEYNITDSFGFSEDGRLVGHIIRGITMIEQGAAQLPDFPPEILRHLIHLIASHHGTQEWGSPVIPKTLEAILLHQIDLLDSRIQGYFDHVNNDDGDGPWTNKSSFMFNTELYYKPEMKS